MNTSKHSPRSGYTLVEVILATAILAVLAQALVEASSLMSRLTASGNVETVMQIESEKIMDAVVADLRRSGFVTVGGKDFPFVFEDGVADDPFREHSHERADHEAEDGDLDFGPTREIVFVLPADDDGDGAPDLDEDGELAWSPMEISYTLMTRAGTNYLERTVDFGEPDQIGAHVERIVFDTPESSGWAIPLGSVRLQIFLRMRDPNGALYRYMNSVVLSLRNGGIE
jgi:prepilin-type N-terminal cleavage/methylation domain-containing protein